MNQLRKDLAAVALFSSVVAAVVGLVGWIAGYGAEHVFDPPSSHGRILSGAVSISWLVLNAHFAAEWLRDRLRTMASANAFGSNFPASTLMALLVVSMISALAWLAEVSLIAAVWILGPLAFLSTCRAYARSASKLQAAAHLTLACVFGLWTAGMVWGSGFLSPVFEAKLLLGAAHIDTLFHATVSNIVRTYGTVSTGLDGVPYVPYNFASHLLFGLLAGFIGCSVLEFYNLAYPAIFVPLMYASLLSLAVLAGHLYQRRLGYQGAAGSSLTSGVLFWLFFLIGFVGVTPQAIAMQMGVWNNIMRGESFLLAMALLMLGCGSVASAFLRRSAPDWRGDGGVHVVFVWLAPPLLALIGLSKITVLLVVLTAAAYAFLRLGLFRYRTFWVSAAASLVLCAVAYLAARGTSGGGPDVHFELFHFWKHHIHVRWGFLPLSLFFYFAWILMFIIWRVVEERISTIGDLRDRIKGGRLLDVELALAVTVASVLPGVLLALPSGGANYFSEVHNWLALALAMACAPLIWEWLSNGRPQAATR